MTFRKKHRFKAKALLPLAWFVLIFTLAAANQPWSGGLLLGLALAGLVAAGFCINQLMEIFDDRSKDE